jgi:tetratricopeptide (TPR) repeat protein
MGIAGNIKTMELAELLQWLSQGGKTGSLVIDDGRYEKRVFFGKGKIISSASSDPREYLGHFLVSHGYITEEQLAEAVRRQESQKLMLGKVLVEMGAIDEESLEVMLRMKAEEGIYSLFTWPEGEFRFHDDELPPYPMVPIDLDVTGLILEAMRRRDELSRFREVMPSPQDVPVRVVEDLVDDPEMDEGTRHILSAVDDQRTIEEISLETHASDYYVCEALYPQIQARRVKIVRSRGNAAPALAAAVPIPAGAGAFSSKTLLERGQKHFAAKEYDQALRHFRAAKSLDPDDKAIAASVEQGEKGIRSLLQGEGLVPEAIPRLAVRPDEISRVRVSPKAGFLLSRVNGSYDIASILKISPMGTIEALLVFRELVQAGLLTLGRRK